MLQIERVTLSLAEGEDRLREKAAAILGLPAGEIQALTILRRLKELGGELILNSDAHHVSHLLGSFQETENIVKEIGFTHVNVWSKDGLQAVGL